MSPNGEDRPDTQPEDTRRVIKEGVVINEIDLTQPLSNS